MKKFAKFIVHNRWVFFGIFVALLIASCILMPFVNLNYDMTKYLSDSSEGKVAFNKMTDEFGNLGSMSVMVENISVEDAEKLNQKIAVVDGVTASLFDGSSETSYKDGSALFTIFLESDAFSSESQNVVKTIQTILDDAGYTYAMNGSSVDMLFYEEYVMKDMAVILVVACIVIAIILLLSSKSYFEPVIFALVLAFAILINMGTNYFLGEISFITNAICAILQLALAMDYSIILLQRYEEEKEKTLDTRTALENALAATFIPIMSSSLTTIAGLLALVFMQFKIGFDVGIVLAKGIVISLFSVFFFMPALIMMFAKPLEKTQHKPIRFKYTGLQKFAEKTKVAIPVILICFIAVAGIYNFKVQYSYVLKTATDEDAQINVDNEKIKNTYGDNNPLLIVLPDSYGYDTQNEIIDYCLNLETNGRQVVKSAQGISQYASITLTQEQAKSEYNLTSTEVSMLWSYLGKSKTESITVGEIVSKYKEMKDDPDQASTLNLLNSIDGVSTMLKLINMLDNGEYSRIIFILDAETTDQDAFDASVQIRTWINENYEDTYVVGESPVYLDIKTTFDSDTTVISLVTVIGIFVLVMLTFKSLSIPVILVGVIQGAIWMNFSINAFANDPIFFVAYLVVMCIQMGATVDYGILMTSRYLEARKTKNKKDSLKEALQSSLPTIFTSGGVLVLAPLLVGLISNVEIISNIGYLLCRGCAFSLALVVLCLPQLLLLCDKLMQKTTIKLKLSDAKLGEKIQVKATELKNEVKDKINNINNPGTVKAEILDSDKNEDGPIIDGTIEEIK